MHRESYCFSFYLQSVYRSNFHGDFKAIEVCLIFGKEKCKMQINALVVFVLIIFFFFILVIAVTGMITGTKINTKFHIGLSGFDFAYDSESSKDNQSKD